MMLENPVHPDEGVHWGARPPMDLAADSGPAGELVVDAQSRIIWINRTLATWLGIEHGRAVGLPLSQFFAGEDARLVSRHVWECLRTDGTVSAEATLCTSESRHVQLASIRTTCRDGRPACRTVLTDITERNRNEAALQFLADAGGILLADPVDSGAMLTRLATLAVCRFCDYCAVYAATEQGERLRCVARESRKGHEQGWQLNSERVDALAATVFSRQENALLDGPAADEFCAGESDKSGAPASWVVLCVPLIARGEVVGAMVFATEGRALTSSEMSTAGELGRRVALAIDQALLVTFLENARDSNEEARAAAEAANRAKDEVFARISHELRAPLAAMTVWLDVLKGCKEGDRAQAMTALERSVRAQSEMVEDLLDITRSVSGKLRVTIDVVDLAVLAQMAVSTCRAQAQARSIKLEITREPPPLLVLGDARRLQQIVLNLLSNALKFTPADGVIEVALVPDAHEVRLIVSDTGRGIRKEDLPHVFTPFRQGEGTDSRPGNGLGLGLAIVRQLVEAHRGKVEAFSDGEGRGARFVVTLPRATGFALRLPSEMPVSGRSLSGARIAVVAPDDSTRALLVHILQSHGAWVTGVPSVQGLSCLLHREHPDLLVCDLPAGDECGLLGRLRAMDGGAHLPVVRLSDVPAAAEDGLSVLVKPASIHSLVRAIESMLRISR